MFDAEPEGWQQTTLGAVAVLGGGTTPAKSNASYWSGGSIPWATPSDITSLPGGAGRIATTNTAITERALEECSLSLNPPDTVLMTSRATIGYAALNDLPMATNQGFITFRCSSGTDPEFLLHWLTANRQTLVGAAGGSTFKELSRSTAKLLPILLPPLEEQRRITEVIRSVDAALQGEEAVLTQLARVRAAAAERFIDEASLAGSVPLSDIIARMDSGWSPDCENTPAQLGEWAVLKTSAITWAGYDDKQNKRLPEGFAPRASLSVEVGDILITRAGPAERTGVVAMVDETVGRRMISDKIIRVRVDPGRACPRAVATVLGGNYVQSQIGRVKSGMAASQTNITQKIVAELEIPIPSLDSQRKFAGLVDAIIRQTKLSVAQRDQLSRTKARLAADLLSGRVRVPA